MDALHGRYEAAGEEARRKLYKNVESSIKQVLATNTPRDSNYTDTCPPSQKLYKFDEPDTQDTAGDARTSS